MATAKIRRIAQAKKQAEKQQRQVCNKKKAEAKQHLGRPKHKLYYTKSRFSLKWLKKLVNNIEITVNVAVPDEPSLKLQGGCTPATSSDPGKSASILMALSREAS